MNERSANSRRVILWVRALFAAWIVATGVGTVFPALRLWGLHLPAFLPVWLQVVFFGVALVFVFPALLHRIADAIPRSFIRIIHSPLGAIVAVMAFVVFRVSVGLLGDGTLRGREAQMAISRPMEILSGHLASWIYNIVHPAFGWNGQNAVAALSIIAGCLFLFFVWYFPRRIWEEPSNRLTVRVILISSGATAMFFGYIESYAIPLAAMVGFLLAAEAFRRERNSFLVCVFLFVLAAAAHFSAMVLFPALVVLALTSRGRRVWRVSLVGIIAAVVIVWAIWIFHGSIFATEAPTDSMLVPLLPQPPVNYGLISPAHLLDVVNLLLLVCPGVLIALPLLLSSRRFRPDTKPRFFWLLAVMIPLSIPLLLDPKLGLARDWDLFTLGLLPLLVWSAIRLADIRYQHPRRALALPVLASASVLMMFVGINANTEVAITRFDKLLELDRARGGYGYEILATHYRSAGQNRMEILQWRKALRSGDNKRYWTNLSMAYMRIGEKESAYFAARRAYLLDTSWTNGVYNMAIAFDEMQMLDSAVMCYTHAARLEPDDLAIRHDLAIALMRYGRTSDAIEQINVAIEQAPDSAVYRGALGWILLSAGYAVEAERALQSALQLNPILVPALANLVLLYEQTGRKEAALTELARLLGFSDLEPELRTYLVNLENQIRAGISRPDTTKESAVPSDGPITDE